MRFCRIRPVRARSLSTISGFGAVDSLLLLMALAVTIAAVTALAFPGSGLGAILAKNNALSAMSQTFVHMNRPVSYFTASGSVAPESPGRLINELRRIAHAVDVSGNGFARLCVGVLQSDRIGPAQVDITVAAPGFVVWDRTSAGLVPCPRVHPDLNNQAAEMINSIGRQQTEVLLAAYSAEEHTSGRDFWLQIAQSERVDPEFVIVPVVAGPPPIVPPGPPVMPPDLEPVVIPPHLQQPILPVDPMAIEPDLMAQFGGDPQPVAYDGGQMPEPQPVR